MVNSDQLEREYRLLLAQAGLLDRIAPPQPVVVRQNLEQFRKEMRITAARGGIEAPALGITSDVQDEVLARGGMNSIVHAHAQLINGAITNLGLSLPAAVYPGVYPTGSINAQARAVPGGVLLLVNVGLMMFVFQTAKIMGLAMRFTDYGPEGRGIVEHPVLRNLDYTREDIVGLMAEVVDAYLTYRDATAARRLPVEGGPRAMLTYWLGDATEMFSLAHEYGHVIRGHLVDSGEEPDHSTESFLRRSWEHELEADLLGAQLVFAVLDAQPRDDLWPLVRASAVAAPLFFFALDHLVDRAIAECAELVGDDLSGKHPPLMSDHPPPEARAAALRNFYAANGIEDTSFADAYGSWVADIEDDVLRVLTATA